jgi:alcohol dehydrogenase/L-iditol 2-dehydrogenase
MTTKNSKMPAVVQYGLKPKQVEIREVDIPDIGDSDVLLRVGAVGICGSEVHQYHATHSWKVNIPVTLGHEFAGTIAACGKDVSGFREGDRVVSETAAVICGACIYCRTGNYNMCPERSGFGYGVDGAMTQYARVPARCLHHIPDTLPFEIAALTEPCCVAYNAAIEQCNIKAGANVLVLGPGPIGLLCLMMAKLRGAGRLIIGGLGADEKRFHIARQIGATDILNLQTENVEAFLQNVGDSFGVDVVIDAAGVSAAFQTALAAVRPLGEIVKVGWGAKALNCSLDPMVQKAVTVRGSFSHNYPTWEHVIALLSSGRLDVRPLISLQAPLQEWQRGFDGMHDGQYAKAVLIP